MENSKMEKAYRHLKSKRPYAVLMFRNADGGYTFIKDDADVANKVLGLNIEGNGSYKTAVLSPCADLSEAVKKLVKSGNRVVICDPL